MLAYMFFPLMSTSGQTFRKNANLTYDGLISPDPDYCCLLTMVAPYPDSDLGSASNVGRTVQKPHYTIVGATQPRPYLEAIRKDNTDGFYSRWSAYIVGNPFPLPGTCGNNRNMIASGLLTDREKFTILSIPYCNGINTTTPYFL